MQGIITLKKDLRGLDFDCRASDFKGKVVSYGN